VAAPSKAWVYGRSLAGIAGSNPAGGRDMSLASVVCCQVEIYATGRSLVRRSPTERGVSLSVTEEPRRGGLGPPGPSSHEKKYTKFEFLSDMLGLTTFI
jgi:hypothetical protein